MVRRSFAAALPPVKNLKSDELNACPVDLMAAPSALVPAVNKIDVPSFADVPVFFK